MRTIFFITSCVEMLVVYLLNWFVTGSEQEEPDATGAVFRPNVAETVEEMSS